MKEIKGSDTEGWYRPGSKKDSGLLVLGEGELVSNAMGVLYTVYRKSLRVEGVHGEGRGQVEDLIWSRSPTVDSFGVPREQQEQPCSDHRVQYGLLP